MSFQGSIPRLPDGPLRDAERNLMANRYLYYVIAHPLLPDSVYDRMEISFLETCDSAGIQDTIMRTVGSSLAESYTADEIAVARRLLGKKAQKYMKE